MCTCRSCGKEYVYDRSKGHTKTLCGSCSVNNRRFELKKKAVALLGGECSICGYSKSLRALEFHHLDPASKKFSISGSHCRKWADVEKELNKCILVCSNCHAELHESEHQC